MADTTNRLAGTAYLVVDGKSYRVSGDMRWNPSKVKRTTLTGMDSVHGYSEEPVAGWIACSIRDSGGLTVADLNAMTNVTLTVELANGKTVVGRNMWAVDTQEVNSTDATIPLRWEGPEVQEI